MEEFIGEIILMSLFAHPGAFIRWALHWGKIPYKVLVKEDSWYNAMYVALLVVMVLIYRSYPSALVQNYAPFSEPLNYTACTFRADLRLPYIASEEFKKLVH